MFVQVGLLRKQFLVLPSCLWDLTLEEAFETVMQHNKKLRKGNSMVPGTKKKSNF